MGGGSGSYVGPTGRTDKEAKDLFDKATKDIEQKIKDGQSGRSEQKEDKEHGTRNVFISFHVDDENQVQLLRAQSKRDDFNLDFYDYSVKEPFSEQWKKNVAAKIALTSATIVMIGPGTSNRKAVQFEIEESYRQNKKVIGVRIYKNERHSIPEEMKRNGAPIINWTMRDIQGELDKE